MTTETVEARDGQAEEAAVFAILTLAFSNDPATRWTWPDPQGISRCFPALRQGIRRGGLRARQRPSHRLGRGRALVPPGASPDDAASGALMQRTADPQTATDGPQIMQQMASYHPKEPHWYLPLIGIDPGTAGQGDWAAP